MSVADLDPAEHDLTPRYSRGPLLGRGGFGAVYRARDVAMGREVALKLLGLERAGPGAVERFLREAAVAATLVHPGIVKVHAAGLHGGQLAIVYELVEGETLAEAMRTLPLRRRAELVRDAARAVGHAHARGVVHRDLKPENLLVGRDGRLRVADFGLAWFEGADRLTRTGGIVGTPSYMAPEQLVGEGQRKPALDVWSLGVVLYEALTGRLPFEGVHLTELMVRLQRAPLTPPRRVDPSIHPGLEAVCLGALERDPARRYPDGEALAQALDDALAGRLGGSRRAWIGWAGAIVAALSLAGGWAAGRGSGPSPAPPPGPTPAPEAAPDSEAEEPAPRPIADRRLLEASAPRWAVWVDARRVLTGGADDELRLWDAATGEQLRTWPRMAARATSCGPGRVALASDAGLDLLEVDGGGRPRSVGSFAAVELVAYAREADALAVVGRAAGEDRRRVFLIASDGAVRQEVLGKEHGIPISLAASPDGAHLAVGTSAVDAEGRSLLVSGPVLIFRAEGAGFRLQHVVLSPSTAEAGVVNPRTREHVFGTIAGQLALIPLEVGAIMDHFHLDEVGGRAHSGAVRAVALSSDGTRLYSLAEVEEEGLEVRVWEYDSREASGAPLRAEGRPFSLDLSPDGQALAIGTRDRGVLVRVVSAR